MPSTASITASLNGSAVASLDPLGADDVLAELPTLNRAADVSALRGAFRTLLPAPEQVTELSPTECLAAMRDLGMLAGSLRRHGEEPALTVEGAEPALVALGLRTAMIPRDTVHHYTEWNPRGARQRMYTGDPQETVLIEAVRRALPRLRAGVARCRALRAAPLHSPLYAPLARGLAEELLGFDEAISDVMARVRPEFFARGLRPYFDDIAVAGRRYLGPAAAHVPLFLVDLALWASDRGDSHYRCFLAESRDHTLPDWRALASRWEQEPSIVTRVARALMGSGPGAGDDAVRAAAEAVGLVLRSLVVFRSKHLVMARRTYREEIRLFPVGSGGGTVELLHDILDLTRRNARLVAPPGGATGARRARAREA